MIALQRCLRDNEWWPKRWVLISVCQFLYIFIVVVQLKMSNEELQEEVNQLRAKLEQTETDFEAYKTSAKELEQFLEEESSKKEDEIRQLKEEFIIKEKGIKQTKQELSMLQNDYAELKAQVVLTVEGSQEDAKTLEELKKMQDLVQSLQSKNADLSSQLKQKTSEISALTEQQSRERKSLQSKLYSLSVQLQERDRRIAAMQFESSKMSRQANQKLKIENGLKKDQSKKDIDMARLQFDKEKDRFEEKIKKLEELLAKAEKQVKDSKHKIQALMQQNEILQSRTVNVTISNGSPSPMLIKNSLQDDDFSARPSYHCLMMTKPHYISPFLEIYEDRGLIKIYKSSRTGCFQKSMGSYKHKFDNIAFDHEGIIEPIATRIKEYEQPAQHSVIFFGVKKSNKKYLMSLLIVQLKEFLLQKMENAEYMEASFLKRSQEEEKNFTMNATDREGIVEVIDKVISLGCKSDKQKSLAGSRKVQAKPKVRYFKIKIDEFSLEVGSSSFTALSFRDKTTVSTMLNNILYAKLPNILQSTIAQKYLVLTLNPIVDLYEDCKNTLSTTFCKFIQEEPREDLDITDNWKNSPVREELNDFAKKKLEVFERQTEETSVKIRKLQDQCGYYKARFDELQFRLKNLLNTHSSQNTYLKKSPVTLSYEKLLKFVHSVQQRNGVSLGHSVSMMLKSNIYGEKDMEGMEAL